MAYDDDFMGSYNPYAQQMQYSGMQPSFLSDLAQPSAPSAGQMFLGGLRNRKQGQNPILAGLSGFAGKGGLMGGIGRAAAFMI